jgi:S1-C subfamily serine protease
LILSIEPGSSAAQADLRGTREVRDGLILGDIIIAADQVPVTDWNQLRDVMEKHEVGESITLTLLRGDKQIEVVVPLDAM